MIIHKELAAGRWFKFTLIEQLANIGSDVIRAINWKIKGDMKACEAALFRALELIDLTVADQKNKGRLREILRTREALVDHFLYDNEYNTTDEQWYNYFFQYNYAASMQRGR